MEKYELVELLEKKISEVDDETADYLKLLIKIAEVDIFGATSDFNRSKDLNKLAYYVEGYDTYVEISKEDYELFKKYGF